MDDKLSGKEKAEIAIEAGLQLIPYVGGSLATLYFSTKQEKRFKRIESFYRELADEIQTMNVQLSPIETHDPEKLASIIEELNDRIEREHIEEKRSYFKNYARNILSSPTNQNYDERKYFLDVLSSMSLLECDLLNLLRTIPIGSGVEVRNISRPGVMQYAIVGAVGRCSTYGFISSGQNTMVLGGGDNALRQVVSLSDYGRRFVRFCLE